MKESMSLFIKTMSLKEEAIVLRTKGLIYKEISEKLNVPLMTICNWTRHIQLTDEQKQTIKTNCFKKVSDFWRDKRLGL